jgi:4-amino-4-deoxy-L-arabinose transferase-like glycosyltransferase
VVSLVRALGTGGWWRRALPGVAVVAIAVLARTWSLGAVGFNSDEAVYTGQAAGLAGDPDIAGLFPVFRAHPLLFQTALSLVLRAGGGDVAARLLVAAMGVATVVLVMRIGRLLYGPRTGLVAGLLLALMPYHVGVSRQVLLDAPMTLFATATLYAVARAVRQRSGRWLLAGGLLLGFTVLSKETAILLALALVLFGVLFPAVRPPVRHLLPAGLAAAVVITVHPLTLALSGRSSTGGSYLLWQLLRRPNHTALFYPQVVPAAMGYGVLAVAVAGLWVLRRRSGWREGLLCCWAVVPSVLFEIWPVKGYQYLLVAAPVVALLAARALTGIPVPRLGPAWARAVRVTAVTVLAASLLVPTWQQVRPAPTTTFLAGSGGLPAGREMGLWMRTHLPAGSRVMTIGPSTANVLRYYAHRPAVGLSVSPDPRSRNPSYDPIDNPDRELRQGTINYVVWDAFTAARTPFFADRLMRYVAKYHGTVLHTETVRIRSGGGEVDQPVMTVYEVRP